MIHCKRCAKEAKVVEQEQYYCCSCWIKYFGKKRHEDTNKVPLQR